MGSLNEVNGSARILHGNFDAFKFPTSDIVQFRALVTPCIPRCDPVYCEVTDYYGRTRNLKSHGKRKKREAKMEKDLMVAGVIRISDKFELDEKSVNRNEDFAEAPQGVWNEEGAAPPTTTSQTSSSCLNTFAVAMGATIFLLAQCVIIAFCTYLYHKHKRHKVMRFNL